MSETFKSSPQITASQIRMARAGLNLTVRQLAQMADVNKATIVRIEAGLQPRQATLDAVKKVLIDQGVVFAVCQDKQNMFVSVGDKVLEPG